LAKETIASIAISEDDMGDTLQDRMETLTGQTNPSKRPAEKIPRRKQSGTVPSGETLKGWAHLVIEKTSDLVSITTFGLKPAFVFINPAHEHILGYVPDDLLGKSPWEFIHPDDQKRLIPLLQNYVATISENDPDPSRERITEKLVYRFRDRLGNWRHLETTGDLLDDRHILFVSKDITAQKELEEALRESEEKYRLLAETAKEMILTVDLGGRITYVNRAALDLSGYEEADLLGKELTSFLPEEQLPTFDEHMNKRIKGDRGLFIYESEFTNRDGLGVPLEVASAPIVGDDRLLGILLTARDISERKQAEQALRESEEKYRLLIENANEAIFIIQDGQVKFPNPKAREIADFLGLDVDKAPFADFIHPEDKAVVLERLDKGTQGEEVSELLPFRLIGRDGRHLWVQIDSVANTWAGKPATLNFLRDVTHLREMENRLQHVRRMEALGTLAGGIAHDFNNLLMGIQGRTSLMLMEAGPSHPHCEELASIEEIVKSGSELTKQLLGFARGGRYDVKPTNINELVSRTSTMFGRTRRDIRIVTTFQEEIWPVEVDRGQMEQVFLNLLVNASQAMPQGGEIRLRTENAVLGRKDVEPYLLDEGQYVKILVADTGPGMDEATQQRIFEPFFSTKKLARGTGLGLASTYGIIKNHKGIITVYSQEGEGTTFEIVLPASKKSVPSEDGSQEEASSGTETILLVDDEEMVLHACGKVLEKLGYTVLLAKDGKEALERFANSSIPIDVVVLDMIMPGMSGKQTFEELKDLDPDVKVLLSTGYSIEGDAAEVLKRGCQGFIQKPFKLAHLAKKIREVLEK
jgi:PAS domain S-box-containing protein